MNGVRIYKSKPQQAPENNIGALWRRYDKNNKIYFCGIIRLNETVVKIVIFENPQRKTEEHPVFIIKKNQVQ